MRLLAVPLVLLLAAFTLAQPPRRQLCVEFVAQLKTTYNMTSVGHGSGGGMIAMSASQRCVRQDQTLKVAGFAPRSISLIQRDSCLYGHTTTDKDSGSCSVHHTDNEDMFDDAFMPENTTFVGYEDANGAACEVWSEDLGHGMSVQYFITAAKTGDGKYRMVRVVQPGFVIDYVSFTAGVPPASMFEVPGDWQCPKDECVDDQPPLPQWPSYGSARVNITAVDFSFQSNVTFDTVSKRSYSRVVMDGSVEEEIMSGGCAYMHTDSGCVVSSVDFDSTVGVPPFSTFTGNTTIRGVDVEIWRAEDEDLTLYVHRADSGSYPMRTESEGITRDYYDWKFAQPDPNLFKLPESWVCDKSQCVEHKRRRPVSSTSGLFARMARPLVAV